MSANHGRRHDEADLVNSFFLPGGILDPEEEEADGSGGPSAQSGFLDDTQPSSTPQEAVRQESSPSAFQLVNAAFLPSQQTPRSVRKLSQNPWDQDNNDNADRVPSTASTNIFSSQDSAQSWVSSQTWQQPQPPQLSSTFSSEGLSAAFLGANGVPEASALFQVPPPPGLYGRNASDTSAHSSESPLLSSHSDVSASQLWNNAAPRLVRDGAYFHPLSPSPSVESINRSDKPSLWEDPAISSPALAAAAPAVTDRPDKGHHIRVVSPVTSRASEPRSKVSHVAPPPGWDGPSRKTEVCPSKSQQWKSGGPDNSTASEDSRDKESTKNTKPKSKNNGGAYSTLSRKQNSKEHPVRGNNSNPCAATGKTRSTRSPTSNVHSGYTRHDPVANGKHRSPRGQHPSAGTRQANTKLSRSNRAQEGRRQGGRSKGTLPKSGEGSHAGLNSGFNSRKAGKGVSARFDDTSPPQPIRSERRHRQQQQPQQNVPCRSTETPLANNRFDQAFGKSRASASGRQMPRTSPSTVLDAHRGNRLSNRQKNVTRKISVDERIVDADSKQTSGTRTKRNRRSGTAIKDAKHVLASAPTTVGGSAADTVETARSDQGDFGNQERPADSNSSDSSTKSPESVTDGAVTDTPVPRAADSAIPSLDPDTARMPGMQSSSNPAQLPESANTRAAAETRERIFSSFPSLLDVQSKLVNTRAVQGLMEKARVLQTVASSWVQWISDVNSSLTGATSSYMLFVRAVLLSVARSMLLLASFSFVVWEYAVIEAMEEIQVAICYAFFYFMPTLCLLVGDIANLPHWTPHIITATAVYAMCSQVQPGTLHEDSNLLNHLKDSTRGLNSPGAGTAASSVDELDGVWDPPSAFTSAAAAARHAASARDRRAFDAFQAVRERDERTCRSMLRILRMALPTFVIADGFSSELGTVIGDRASSRLTTAFMMVLVRKNLISSPIGWISWALQVLVSTYVPPGTFVDQAILVIGLSSIRLVRYLELERLKGIDPRRKSQ